MQINISAGGVPKLPIPHADVSRLGIAGDQHLYKLHGGPDRALMIMAAEFIEQLASEGFSVYFGALGENLTVRGFQPGEFKAGQRYRVGGVLLELTEPRTPCGKLRPYGKGIEKRLLSQPGESGFYAAVIESGVINPGDMFGLVTGDPE